MVMRVTMFVVVPATAIGTVLVIMAAAIAVVPVGLGFKGTRLAYLEQLYLEIERLTSQKMVVVKEHDAVFDLRAHHLNLLAVLRLQHKGLANGQLFPIRNKIARHLLDEIGAPFAITLGRLDAHGSLLARLHLGNRLVKTHDHMTAADDKLKRLPQLVAVVELAPVVVGADVVNSNLAAQSNHALSFPNRPPPGRLRRDHTARICDMCPILQEMPPKTGRHPDIHNGRRSEPARPDKSAQ